MNRQIKYLLLTVLGIPSGLFADPVISIDSVKFNVDTIVQGQVSHVRHEFAIRNSGTSVLRINRVRASCGCTTVEVDSTILPGREGSIAVEVATHELHEGTFTKDVTVLSNAANMPSLRLFISGYFKTVLEVENRSSLRLSPLKASDTGAIVRVWTSKKFKVEKVAFKFKERELGMDWETSIPVKFTYEYPSSGEGTSGSTGKKYGDKQQVCQIRLFYASGPTSDKWGEFAITTDLDAKKVIILPGMLEKER